MLLSFLSRDSIHPGEFRRQLRFRLEEPLRKLQELAPALAVGAVAVEAGARNKVAQAEVADTCSPSERVILL